MTRLEELLDIIASEEFVARGRMRIVRAEWSAGRLTLRAQVRDGSGDETAWQFRFSGVVEQSLTVIDECGLNVWHDHVAIAQYTAPREFLHFGVRPRDVHEVIGALWSAHVSVADDWIPFDRYLNGEKPLDELLTAGSGLLATGPDFLIERYAEVLTQHACGPKRQRLPTRPRPADLVMAHFGESYVIAETLTIRKLPTQ